MSSDPVLREAISSTKSGGLPCSLDNVAIAGVVGLGVHAEGEEQVGNPPGPAAGQAALRHHGDVALCGDQGGLRVSQVLGQVVSVPGLVQVVYGAHLLVKLAFRRVRQDETLSGLRLFRCGVGGGHAEPLGLGGVV